MKTLKKQRLPAALDSAGALPSESFSRAATPLATATLVGLLFLLPCLASATSLPFYDGFETYAVGTSLTNGPNGWGASDSAVVVETNVVSSLLPGTNAVVLPPAATVSNLVVSAVLTNMWTDFYLTNAVGTPVDAVGPEAVNTNMTVQWFVETNGYPVVWHPASNAWVVCSNDYWSTPTTVFNTNAWMRFTLCQNYSNQTAALFLNQHLLMQQVRFIDTNRTQSGRFQLTGGYGGTSYFDEVSIRYAPTNFTADLDNDGMADADEIQLYGSVGVRHRPLITVAQPTHLAITPAGPFTVLPGSSTNFTLTADKAYVVSQVFSNGQSVAFTWQQSTRTTTLSWPNMIPDGLSDGSVSGTVSYTGLRYVPYDYGTVQLAMAAAVPGESVIVSGGPYSGDVTLSNGVALVATNVTLTGNLTLGAGTTGTLSACSGLVVGGTTTVNGLLVVSNGTVNLGTMTIGAGGAVQLVNATSFVANGITLTGAFTLNQKQTPPFSDDFERYTNGTTLASLGYFGWGASDPGVVVQGSVYTQGFKAVAMPVSTVLSNSLAPAASSNVWMEWKYKESDRIDESKVNLSEITNMTVIMFINTNNYLTVRNPETSQFNVLSNDIMGNAVAKLSTSDWPRVSVNFNYVTKRAAVLLNGRLLVQQLRFVNTNQNNCARLEWDAGYSGSTYVDALNVSTNAASIASDDADGDGLSDALEIDQKGNIYDLPLLAAPTVSAIGTNGATLAVSITNTCGGAAITSWGTVWGTALDPLGNLAAVTGSTNAPFSFTTNVVGFSPGQHYYVRGWASNVVGLAYSTNGEFYAEPVQASNIAYVPVVGGFTISWTADATSTGTVVLVRQGDVVNAAPEDGSNYVVTAAFGTDNAYLGSSNYIVYAGYGGTNVTVSNLAYGVHYTAAAYAFAGCSNLIQYRTNSPSTCLLQWPPQGSVFKIR